MTSLTLPYPPTTNNLYVNTAKGRVKSQGYKAWLTEAGWEVRRQRPAPVHGRYRLSILATAPDLRARDVDNLIKPVSDLLKKAGVIDEDSLAKGVSADWSDSKPSPPGFVLVTVEPYPADVQIAAVAA